MTAFQQIGVEPRDHGHVFLYFGGDAVGQAVQELAVFAQRLAVVAQVEHAGVIGTRLGLEPVDGSAEELVGLENRVVVGVHQLGVRAVCEDFGGAFGLELLGRCGRTFGIRGAVAAHLMEHQQDAVGALVRWNRGDALVDVVEHHHVAAFAAGVTVSLALLAVQPIGGRGVWHAVADALAARLIVDPQDIHAGGLDHVEQRFVVILAGLEGFFAQGREHAGHGCERAGAAGVHILPIDDIARGQLRCGVTCIAVEAEMVGAASLAHHEHEERRLLLIGKALAKCSARAHGDERLAFGDQGTNDRHARGVQAGDRVEHVAQLRVVAHQRCQVARHGADDGGSHRQRYGEKQRIADALAHHAHGRNAHTQQPPERNREHQHDTDEQAPAKQVGDFVGVGLQHVGGHPRIHHHAVGQHVVLGKRGDEGHRKPEESETARPRGEGKNGDQPARGQHAQNERRSHVEAGGSADACQLEPQGPVGRKHQIDGEKDNNFLRRHGRLELVVNGAQRLHQAGQQGGVCGASHARCRQRFADRRRVHCRLSCIGLLSSAEAFLARKYC